MGEIIRVLLGHMYLLEGSRQSWVAIFRTISQKRKPSEFHSEPFLGRENLWEFRFEPFLDEKNLGIPFRTIFRKEKSSEFRSESFPEEKKLGKRQLLLAASLNFIISRNSVPFQVMEWTLPKYSESHGMSTLFHGITKTVLSLFRGIFLRTKCRWQSYTRVIRLKW